MSSPTSIVPECADTPVKSAAYFLVEGDFFSITASPNEADLIEAVRKKYASEDVEYRCVAIVKGERIHLSKGPHRYLLVNGAEPIPLEAPVPIEPDPDVWLVARSASAERPARAAASEESGPLEYDDALEF